MGIAQRSRAYFIPPIGEIVYSKVAPPIGGVFFSAELGQQMGPTKTASIPGRRRI